MSERGVVQAEKRGLRKWGWGWRLLALPVLCGALIPMACRNPTDPAGQEKVSEVAASELSPLPSDQLYRYRFAGLQADSVLPVLRRANLPLLEAWQPIEDLCMDPLGPRLTVVLSTADKRIEAYDFEPGNGIRACTVRVRRYVFGR